MKTVICPGSFDPVTVGHLDIIRRSAAMFDKVIVVAMTNYHKKNTYAFSAAERVALLKRCTKDIPNVEVDAYDGLLAEYARQKTNQKLNGDLETIFIASTAENMFLSSSVVKQVCELGGDIGNFVPEEIRDDIIKRISRGEEK